MGRTARPVQRSLREVGRRPEGVRAEAEREPWPEVDEQRRLHTESFAAMRAAQQREPRRTAEPE